MPRFINWAWMAQPTQKPSEVSSHINTMQIKQIVRGRVPWMSTFVMTVIAPAMPRPIDHANRFGFADTHCGDRGGATGGASTIPVGLYWNPANTRIRNSTKKKVDTTLIGRKRCSKYA